MTTTLASLCADDVDALSKCFGYMLGKESEYDLASHCDKRVWSYLGVSDHVHHCNASRVKLVDHLLRGNTNSANKESSLVFDNDLSQFRKLTLSVVVLWEG